MDKLMDFKETMRCLKTSRATLYRWVEDGVIPAIKMGRQWRFKAAQIDKWLDGQSNTKARKRR